MALGEFAMDHPIEISDGSDSDNAADRDLMALDRDKCKYWYRLPVDTDTSAARLPEQDLIDLTKNELEVEMPSQCESMIIDLTGVDDSAESCSNISLNQDGSFTAAKWIKPEFQFNNSALTEDSLEMPNHSTETCSSLSENGTSSSGRTTVNRDLGALECTSNVVVEKNGFPAGYEDDCIKCPFIGNHTLEGTHVLSNTNSPHSTTPINGTVIPTVDSESLSVATSTTTPSALNVLIDENPDPNDNTAIQASPINKAWLYKFRYYKQPPVHLLFQRLKQDQEHKQLIPSRRMNIVNSTKEESFPQGTLHFLKEFVSSCYYPPKHILCHVIRSILLGKEESSTVTDAYTLLMKVQELHPASENTVAWDWSLFTEVMKKKENPAYLLFLQYVVQTLHDDYHIGLRRRALQKCLAKSMLSCDKSPRNIKDVINWLMDAVKSDDELSPMFLSESENQREVPLLQRLLSIAVEVDNSPACSSMKIAEFLFPFIISIKAREQRDLFFSSIESSLLQAKILEVIFFHSCQKPTTLPLSLAKILFFIEHSTLLLEQQGPGMEWQRWDEVLHHICLLFISYQRIVLDNLLTPATERIDQILHIPNQQLNDITEADVKHHLANFKLRIAQGEEVPPAIQDRLQILQILLCAAVKCQL
ncbi:SUMO-interacting motif-containing protein 1 [Pelodytes ibericus]